MSHPQQHLEAVLRYVDRFGLPENTSRQTVRREKQRECYKETNFGPIIVERHVERVPEQASVNAIQHQSLVRPERPQPSTDAWLGSGSAQCLHPCAAGCLLLFAFAGHADRPDV